MITAALRLRCDLIQLTPGWMGYKGCGRGAGLFFPACVGRIVGLKGVG